MQLLFCWRRVCQGFVDSRVKDRFTLIPFRLQYNTVRIINYLIIIVTVLLSLKVVWFGGGVEGIYSDIIFRFCRVFYTRCESFIKFCPATAEILPSYMMT